MRIRPDSTHPARSSTSLPGLARRTRRTRLTRSASGWCLLGSLVAVAFGGCSSGAEREPIAATSQALDPLPDRGSIVVSVDPSKHLGTVVTGGGVVLTGFTNYISAAHAATPLVAALPHRLNRVHFSGETPDASFQTNDRNAAQFPQPQPPPAAWDFSWMDGPVRAALAVRAASGTDFIVSVHNAPTWMTASGKVGSAPASAQVFATYAARLVAYYNKGSFVDDAGRTVTNPTGPAGVRYWEIWCEPEINDMGGGTTPDFTPTEYAALFKAAAAAMRAVDPTIKIGGPNGISDVDETFRYASALIASGANPDFIAYHQYQAERWMADDEAFTMAAKILSRPNTTLPIVIGETNADSSDAQTRTGSPFEWAAMPLLYKSHVEAGTWRVIRWETYEKSYNLIDATTGKPVTTYWSERAFWEAVQEGSTRVACSSPTTDVACLAVLDAAGRLRVVLVNRGVISTTVFNGAGVRYSVTVAGGPASATYRRTVVDRTTAPESGPVVGLGDATAIAIDGYGLATIEELASPSDAGVVEAGADAAVDVGADTLQHDAADAADAVATDSGAADTGVHDSGAPDTGAHDSAPEDTGAHDTAPADTGPIDAGGMPDTIDAAPSDTGEVVDVAVPDSTVADDTASSEVGGLDSEASDAGFADVVAADSGDLQGDVPDVAVADASDDDGLAAGGDDASLADAMDGGPSETGSVETGARDDAEGVTDAPPVPPAPDAAVDAPTAPPAEPATPPATPPVTDDGCSCQTPGGATAAAPSMGALAAIFLALAGARARRARHSKVRDAGRSPS
jgi:MYXO-CTERM domain-containing protein